MKKSNSILWLLLISVQLVSAQVKTTDLLELKKNSKNEIFRNQGKAVKNGGFYRKGYWVWDNSVIKGDDGKYHLFSSCYSDTIVFHPGWMVSAEIIHSVGDKLGVLFQYVGNGLETRGARYLNGRLVFNLQIFKHKDKYYIFYAGSIHSF